MPVTAAGVDSVIEFTYSETYTEATATHRAMDGSTEVILSRIVSVEPNNGPVTAIETQTYDGTVVWTGEHTVDWDDALSLPGLVCSIHYQEPPEAQLARVVKRAGGDARTEESA